MRLIRRLSGLLAMLFFLPSCGSDAGVGDASYQVSFTSTWSATTHPDNFPTSPHFSGLIGATHNQYDNYWKINELATAGIETMAETGSKASLSDQINQNIAIGNTGSLISEAGISTSPGSLQFTLVLKQDYPLVTLVSMLAPSPDWFVGVSALSLINAGQWLERKTVTLYVYDAGTDDGASYTSADLDSTPKQVIQRIEAAPFLVDGNVKAVGELVFIKL